MTTVKQQPIMSDEQASDLVKRIAAGNGRPIRSPILRTPADYGLDYDDVTFPSLDGVALEAWYMPCEGSDKLVIANHPMGFNRYGFPSHLEPWKSQYAMGGNDFEVDFVPDYRILHDAGYNVLAYDLRNYGHSGAANGGVNSSGRYEARDVVGSLIYARERSDLKHMKVGLFSRCLGCNATMFAMQEYPQYFDGVRCLVAPQPLSKAAVLGRILALNGIPERLDELEREVKLVVSFSFDEMSPIPWAKSVTVPTFLYQVRDDLLTTSADVQAMFDNVPVLDKKLHWIEGTTSRWDGYLYFQREPGQMLEWFDLHMG